MRRLFWTAALPAMALSTAVQAQDFLSFDGSGNWYIQGGGGLNWAQDIDLNGVSIESGDPPEFFSGTASYDMGWLAGGAFGYEFANGFRAELEGMYRSNDLEQLTISGAPIPATGHIDVASIMVNLLYDIDTGSDLTPYLGGGIGAGNVDSALSIGPFDLSSSEWGLALQAIAGLSWAVSPEFELFTQYHYFTVLDTENSTTLTDFPSGGIDTTVSFNDDYVAHSLFFGARYHFLPPPPPPPAPVPVEPPPPPPPAQDRFIVFFDWDRSNLTPQANGVLDQVVATYNQVGFAQVLAEAHTDTSGPATYNVGLSQRRGESVRQGLIARGIAPDEIVVRAFGETQLLVPTPDGVREPQNRRVEIVLM
ncbi:MAG: OmpA family protein [Azospirillaceae bacterium]